MKVAALQYQYDFFDHFDAYQDKISAVVSAHKGNDLLVFPEYAGLEMLSFAPLDVFFDYTDRYMNLFQELSKRHHMWICTGSQFARENGKTYNRSFLFSPHGKVGYQDKCMLVQEEIEEGILSQGKETHLFETDFGKIAICICYDVEFPSLVHPLIKAGAHLIIVPSYTSSIHGVNRVQISARARALENQCFVVQSPLVGQTDVEMAYGAASIYGPINEPFPEDGILEIGKRDISTTVTATLDFALLKEVRQKGRTRNFEDGLNCGEKKVVLTNLV